MINTGRNHLSSATNVSQIIKSFFSRQPVKSQANYNVCSSHSFRNQLSTMSEQRFGKCSKAEGVDSLNVVNRKHLGAFRNTYCVCCSPVPVISKCGMHLSSAQLVQEDAVLAGDKIVNVKLQTARVDAVLKVGLSLSRKKIEKALYEDRVRVNGERPKKKSETVTEGDELDIVRGYNLLNPDFLDVSRVEVISIGDDAGEGEEDSDDENAKIPAVLKKSKVLTIKNYATPWKGNSSD